MNTPKVSVIVPCYKVEKYLDRCVSSLVNQTLEEIEIILVDDKSPDLVPWLCDKWAEKDNRIKVIHKPKNEGLGLARNTGMKVASGDYIVFADSDDVYELEACEKMYSMAIEYNADVVTCGYVTEILPNVWKKDVYAHYGVLKKNEIQRYVLDLISSPPNVRMERLHPVSVWALCLRSTIIRDNNIEFYSEREVLSEDILFKMTFLRHCDVMVCLSEPLYYYCYTISSLTHSFRSSAFENIKVLRNKMIDVVGNDENVLQRIDRFTISEIRTHITRLVKSDESQKVQIINKILDDKIWDDVASFRPSFYGPYARLFYNLCLWKCGTMLYIYVWLGIRMKYFADKIFAYREIFVPTFKTQY